MCTLSLHTPPHTHTVCDALAVNVQIYNTLQASFQACHMCCSSCSSCSIQVIQLFCYTCPKPNHKSHFDSNNSALRAKLQFSKCSPFPPPLHFSCTSCFICMLWQAHVVWQIQQLVHKLRIRIYPFLLHIPRRTWSIIRRRFLKTVTLPALELSKRITLKRPPLSSARTCWPTLVAWLLCATHVATLECWQHFNCTEKQ